MGNRKTFCGIVEGCVGGESKEIEKRMGRLSGLYNWCGELFGVIGWGFLVCGGKSLTHEP